MNAIDEKDPYPSEGANKLHPVVVRYRSVTLSFWATNRRYVALSADAESPKESPGVRPLKMPSWALIKTTPGTTACVLAFMAGYGRISDRHV